MGPFCVVLVLFIMDNARGNAMQVHIAVMDWTHQGVCCKELRDSRPTFNVLKMRGFAPYILIRTKLRCTLTIA